MKPVQCRLAAILTLLLCIGTFAQASPPILDELKNANGQIEQPFPTEVRPGDSYSFHLKYTQAEGDHPKKLQMFLDTPGGPIIVPGQVTEGTDAASGMTITWSYTPLNSGTYRYHFQATSVTDTSAQYPAPPADDLEFLSISLVTKFLIFLAGLGICLFLLPFIVYLAVRSLSQRSDPTAAARAALLIGLAASCALALSLFVLTSFNYLWLGWGLGAVVVLAFLVVLFSRRRAV